MATAVTDGGRLPTPGELVEIRGQRWVTADVTSPVEGGSTVVELQSVEDGRYGEALTVVWEVEPGRRVLPASSLPDIDGGFDPPSRLAAFLHAVRWSAVTSADVRMLQAPFRSGVAVENYQLVPVARAVGAPRVNLLLADDVGLGKTIEAGLVTLELLLRHRAKRVMVICPAGLTLKWQEEMAEKFGLEFTVVDSECCAAVRRAYGSAANPFRIFPLVIASLPWLRGPRGQRLLNEVFPAEDRRDGSPGTRPFDLLILDEAHHVAPAAPRQAYAVDSQQTKLIRRLAPHFEHRLFLTATPHNGYPESFTALLELLDDQRFIRALEPDPAAEREVVVRRLKSQIKNADGSPRFHERASYAISVTYPPAERAVHGLLQEYAQLRRRRITTSRRGRRAADLVTLLLKKRLFSSPAAFVRTVGVYLETIARGAPVLAPAHAERDEVPEWLDSYLEEAASLDDERLAESEDDALRRAGPLQPAASEEERELLEGMERWAMGHEATPDAKARTLMDRLRAICMPDGRFWTNERVVVFTEYRDTQLWLAKLLRQEGLGAERVAELHGQMSPDEREQLRLAFQAEPGNEGIRAMRILLATDAASEGIDLQRHCHRIFNYDIPFNPNKLEQRIGRIDRYGQEHTPEIFHFIGHGWERAGDAYEADLEFLARVARKVARMEEDLGAVNAVLAEAVQRRMLGDLPDFDIDRAGAPTRGRRATGRIAPDANADDEVPRLRRELDETTEALALTPANVEQVVDTALQLAHQQPLIPTLDERELAEGLFAVPTLTDSWSRATAHLAERLREDEAVPRQRPITFDAAVARGRDDVVLAHLGHPLVEMSAHLLRAAVWSTTTGLHRVCAVVSDDPGLETTLVGAYARFVLVGADGVRLHEEVLHAGGWVRAGARFARLENLSVIEGIMRRGIADGRPASPPLEARLVRAWPQVRDGLVGALEWRRRQRQQSLQNLLDQRREYEVQRVDANTEQFAASLRRGLAEDSDDDQLQLELSDPREQAQWRRDRQSWRDRLGQLESDRGSAVAAIEDRYRDRTPHLFPVAVLFVVPRFEAAG
ncbi:MAG: DISARM system SNF2-like helicase DrmD [Candidatus Dormibacteraeota bacterium]|nr:DISARM system SNF2-like helicase DrmD [Candidatus Dormibacteraeota bacterium]